MLKICSKCKTEFPLTDEFYYRDRTKSTGFKPYCKTCAKRSEWKRKYPKGTEEQLNHYISCKVCDCCGTPFKDENDKHQDHNHENGRVRGVLCRGCNTAYGYLKENSQQIVSLLIYSMEN